MPDFVGTEKEDDVISELTKACNAVPNLKLYLWYDENDKVDTKDFISKWDRIPHHNFKTIIRPQFFDMQRDFIWYDIIPKKFSKQVNYWRFAFQYNTGVDGILKGIRNFKDTYDFVSMDKEKPVRKQKRNDGEDSNYRE
tara:strand:- start:1561 stop:1977 length:417 start_codon:yes stop_codon:yes gene_type:complete